MLFRVIKKTHNFCQALHEVALSGSFPEGLTHSSPFRCETLIEPKLFLRSFQESKIFILRRIKVQHNLRVPVTTKTKGDIMWLFRPNGVTTKVVYI